MNTTITTLTITENDGSTWTLEGVVRNGMLNGKKGVKVNMATLPANCTVAHRNEVKAAAKPAAVRFARPDLTPMAAIAYGKRSK